MQTKAHPVKLRSICTIERLLVHINKFFNKVSFKKNYLSVQLSFYDEKGKSIQIGDPYFLNASSVKEVKAYKFYLSRIYTTQTLKEHGINKIDNLVFENTEYTKKEYVRLASMKVAN